MAQPATTTTRPPIAAEDHPPPPSHSPLSQSVSIKQEPRDSTTTTTTTAAVDQLPNQNDQPNTQLSQSEQQPPPPSIPMAELRNLSAALSAFQCCFNDLQNQLNTLKTAVDSLIITIPPQENSNVTFPPLQNSNITLTRPQNSIQQSPPMVVTTASAPIEEKLDEKSEKCEENSTKGPSPELEAFCQTMCGRSLKKYLVSNLNEIDKLREEVPKALKQAPNPAKLVLECTGRFFLQGSKAYVNKDSPMVTGREASVLVLECFLLMRAVENAVVEIEKEVKEEADRAALLWRKRMLNEGGVSRACDIDARGLLLLVGCFGVPERFKNEDLRDLIWASNAREISGTLRKSSVLMEKIPELIEGMLKNKMEVDAVDLVYIFGLEDRFNTQTILTSFLKKSKELTKKAKRVAQASPAALNLANKRKIDVLKSVLKCLEGHKIDPSKLLPGWKLGEKISTLEKVVAEFDEKNGEETSQKRKANEAEPAKNLKPREVKRSRYNGQGLQKQNAIGHIESHRHLIDNSIPSYLSSYSASPSMLYAPGTGQYAGVYGGMTVDPAGYMTNHSVQSYGWRGDPALTERVVAHSYANQPSSSSISGLYVASPSLEAYSMVPSASSVGISSRSASDLYQFADAVVKNEYQPPVVPSHHTSYLK